MNILLDTHILLWVLTEDDRLPAGVMEMTKNTGNSIFFSSISMWEIAIKQSNGKLELLFSPEKLYEICLDRDILVKQILPTHLNQLKDLPKIHNDPFDRIMLAQAKTEDFIFVTHDSLVAGYDVLKEAGEKIGAFKAEYCIETIGINTRAQLAAADKALRMRKEQALMEAGVTIIDPNTTFIDGDVEIGQDTIIYPNTYIEGNTIIGEDCKIGPNIRFTDMKVGNKVTAQFSYCHEAEICDGVTLGPYVHIRPGTTIGENVKIGNFVEVKNSNVGEGSKLPHLQYIGDADVGSGVNIGCGTVTCNYDGKKKFRTTIGDNAFIGCNTNLVAPVTVEEGAYIAAGSTITKNVPKGNLAVARSRQTNIEVWNDKRK